jgi:hypothetical protein
MSAPLVVANAMNSDPNAVLGHQAMHYAKAGDIDLGLRYLRRAIRVALSASNHIHLVVLVEEYLFLQQIGGSIAPRLRTAQVRPLFKLCYESKTYWSRSNIRFHHIFSKTHLYTYSDWYVAH